MSHQDDIKAIVTSVGGAANIKSLTHCATRLRFELNDAGKVDNATLDANKLVLGAVPQSGDRYQVVIGGQVASVYEQIMHLPEMAGLGAGTVDDNADEPTDAEVKAAARSKARGKVAWLDSFFEYLADSFRPILGVLLGASIIIALVNLCISLGLIPNDTATTGLVFVQAIWKGVFYFLPMMACVDTEKRAACAANHSCTHLLDEALRQVLGTHVEQKGSLVTPESLRFDFSHFQKVTDEQLREVEHLVNAKIRENIPLTEYRNLPIEKAKELGAIALFGEKYGDEVRVVQFGNSIEFCGGTHVPATGKIGMVRIISESSVAAGVRRIEAITGAKVEELMDTVQDTLNDLKALFNNAPDLKVAIRKYIDENAGLKKQVEEFMKEKGAALKARLVENAKEINGVKVVKAIIPMSADVVKDIAFQLKGEIPANLFVVIGSVDNNKPMLTVMISEDLVKAGQNAGKLVREAAKLIQGGGGGQPHFATAGGKNPDGLNAAVDKVIELAAL